MMKTLAVDLPPNVVAKDLKYPSYKGKARMFYDKDYGGFQGHLKFHKTARFGWCIATLHISNAPRRASNQTPRTYGIAIEDDKTVSIGAGPHILKTVEVYVTTANIKRLQKYVDKWRTGMVNAGTIRDSISTRRANTAMRRVSFGSQLGWMK